MQELFEGSGSLNSRGKLTAGRWRQSLARIPPSLQPYVCLDPSRRGDCQHGRLRACPLSPEECRGVAVSRGQKSCRVAGRGSSVLEEELLSLQAAQGCPAVRLLKHQVSLAALTKSSSSTLSILCFCFLAPVRAGCAEPLSSGFALL